MFLLTLKNKTKQKTKETIKHYFCDRKGDNRIQRKLRKLYVEQRNKSKRNQLRSRAKTICNVHSPSLRISKANPSRETREQPSYLLD